MSADTLVFILTSGVLLGALYGLMASGLAVVWTTIGVFNFAHGAFLALGAYIAWQVTQSPLGAVGFWGAAATAAGVMFLIGFGTHYLILRPLERKANLVLLAVVTTLAVASIVEASILLQWGPRDKQIERAVAGTVGVGGSRVSLFDIVGLVTAMVTLGVLALFLRRTRSGQAMRAVAQNREAAELLGLNTSRLYATTMGLAAAFAGLAGVFIGSIRFMTPSFGADPLMKSLVVVILGGLARFSSPILAAFIVGIVEAFATYYYGLFWAPAILFALMVAVLMLKPEGLFGRRTRTL